MLNIRYARVKQRIQFLDIRIFKPLAPWPLGSWILFSNWRRTKNTLQRYCCWYISILLVYGYWHPSSLSHADQEKNLLRSSQGKIRIHEIRISETSSVIDKKISESGIRDKYDLLVLGIKRLGREIEFNPSPLSTIEKGMTVIVMGEVDNITKARSAF